MKRPAPSYLSFCGRVDAKCDERWTR